MQVVTLFIAVVGFVLSIYTFVTDRLGRLPKLQIFRFAPDGLVVDDDFDTLHVYTDADFIITNLSDKPNTIVRLEVSANAGNGWMTGLVHGKRLAEHMRTRTEYAGSSGEPRHHNEIIHEWVDADVCPIMLAPQSSNIPNEGISLRFDFQGKGPIRDLTGLRLRLDVYDQYGRRHRFDMGTAELPLPGVRRYPKFVDGETELGRLKDRIPDEDMDALVRVVHVRYDPNPAQSRLSVRRHYPLEGGRRIANVAHVGRDGYAYNDYRPKDLEKALREQDEGPYVLGETDGFEVSFSATGGLPDVLHIRMPPSWTHERLDVPIPEDFARLCGLEG